MAFEKKVVEGMRWFAAAKAFSQVFEFVVATIALMNLLDPKDFGRLGMITVIAGLVLILSNVGLMSALIQKEDLEDKHLNAVFWTHLALGLFFGTIFFLSAPVIAAFFDDPSLIPIARVCSFLFIAAPLGRVQNAWLTKNLEFRKISIADVISNVVANSAALILALMGYGVWAIVVKLLLEYLMPVIVMWLMSSFRPTFSFDKDALNEMLDYGVSLTGFSVLQYFSRNFDDFLIGKFFGSAQLGYYQKAYSFMMLPVKQISLVIGRVMFPAMAMHQNDHEKLRDIYVDSNAAIAALSFPILAFLFVSSDFLVPTLFGEAWLPMVPIVKVFCVAGALQSIGKTVNWIYQSTGETRLMFLYGLAETSVLAIAIGIGVYRGSALHVAECYTLAIVLIIVPQMWVPCRLISLDPRRIFKAVVLPGILSVAAAFGAHQVLRFEMGTTLSLIAVTGAFLALYIPLLWIVNPQGMIALRAMFFHKE